MATNSENFFKAEPSLIVFSASYLPSSKVLVSCESLII